MGVLLSPLYGLPGNPFVEFPDGILFTPEVGGLPKPTGAAADYFHSGMLQLLDQGKEQLPDLCTSEGRDVLSQLLVDDYNSHAEDFRNYAEQNCDAIFRTERTLDMAQRLTATGARAVMAVLPDAAVFVPDERVRNAIAEVLIRYDLDS